MTLDAVVDRLAAHRTLAGAPREELAWLAAHGTLRHLEADDVLSTKGVPVAGMYIVLSGRIGLFVDRGAGVHKMLEWHGGDVTGLLPYSRLASPPGNAIAQEPTDILAIEPERLREVVLECHEVTTLLVHAMLDRARVFTSTGLHDEKMVSLGKLSAGLAHELNNPVAAIERSAALLDDRLEEAQAASRSLGAAHLTDSQLQAVAGFRTRCVTSPVEGIRSPIEQAEYEESLGDWLAGHGADETMGEVLAESGVTVEALDGLRRTITGAALPIAVRWVASGCVVHRLASEIQEAAMRISGLVAAIKGFTHMDQASVAEPVNVRQGLANTVTVLQAKARAKAVSVAVHTEPDLPLVRGFAGELNQVWANLIDNALDAVPQSGRVEIAAGHEGRLVTVRIVDNGSGIPAEIRDRIFDPFFTTKPVGRGTGLGLDIVRRLVIHNQGDISVVSQPGRTEFRVVLPVTDAEPGTPA